MISAKVLYKPYGGDEVYDITELIVSFSITKTYGVKNNTWKMSLKNPFYYWNNTNREWVKFQARGLDVGCEFYFYIAENEPADTTNLNHLYFTGVLNKVSQSVTSTKALELTGLDINTVQLSAVWNKAYYGKTASEIVVDIANHIFTGVSIDTSNVQETTQIIDAYIVRGEPFYKVLEDLGREEYTGSETPFVFYMKNNSLYWFEPSLTYSQEIVLSNIGIVNKTVKRSTEGAVNHVMFYAGDDKDGVGITDHYFDPSINKGKTKSVWMNYAFVSKNIQEELEKEGTWTTTTNSEFRAMCIERARQLAKNLVIGMGNPRFEVDVFMKPNFNYAIGDLIKVVSYEDNINRVLRVREITQQYSNKNFRTKLKLKEDYLTVSQGE